MTEPIVNDLTIQAATVNGSGSQTANLVLTRAIFHMGIPVAPKNVTIDCQMELSLKQCD